MTDYRISSRSSGWVRRRVAKKHEIYAAAFGGHLFYDLFLQGQGREAMSPFPRSATFRSLLYAILDPPSR